MLILVNRKGSGNIKHAVKADQIWKLTNKIYQNQIIDDQNSWQTSVLTFVRMHFTRCRPFDSREGRRNVKWGPDPASEAVERRRHRSLLMLLIFCLISKLQSFHTPFQYPSLICLQRGGGRRQFIMMQPHKHTYNQIQNFDAWMLFLTWALNSQTSSKRP